MTLHRIEIFVQVAKHLSYTRAAKELYISQPAVTKNIQELEQELGKRLFDRRGNSIELTPAGEKVYAYGVKLNRIIQNLKYELSEMDGIFSGNLHIGASSTISQYLIPPVIARFKQENPQAEISLISGNTLEINNELGKDQIDVGITEGDRRLNRFSYTDFLEDEIVFASSSDSNILSDDLTIEQLKQMPLVIRESGSGTREVFEDALGGLGIKLWELNILISLGSTESIKSFLLDTQDAVGVFSAHAIRPHEKDKFKISSLKDHPIKRSLSFITHQGAEHKLAERFIRFCRRSYNL